MFHARPVIESVSANLPAGNGHRHEDAALAESGIQVHVVIKGYATGEPAVLLVEREPQIVEFPCINVSAAELDDEEWLSSRIEAETGLAVIVEGYVEPAIQNGSPAAAARFLVVRSLGGTPAPSGSHLGWEWRPASGLLSLQFIPKLMVNGLRSYVNE
jgi:hypothetical protein